MDNRRFKQWIRWLIAAAIIGLSVGGGAWIYRRASRSALGEPANSNAAPEIKADSETALDQTREALGDRLSEALLHLREEENGLAIRSLNEAETFAAQYEARETELAKRNVEFAADIKRARAEVEQNKIEAAVDLIENILDRLNVPIN